MLLYLLLSVGAVSGLYTTNDDVLVITSPSDFNKKVVDTDDPAIVEFFAPWCGHCKNLASEWKKAATALKGIAKVVAVDADAHREIGAPYDIKGFPTIKFFGVDKKKPQDYNGERTANGIVEYVIRELKSIATARLGGKAKPQRSRSSGSDSGSDSGSGGDGGPSAVVTLTASNFAEKVLESNEPWLVEFFAPWCGHCKNLAPAWEAAAKKLKGKVNLGAVDATVESSLGSEYGVRGYPTIKAFRAGSKKTPLDYSGGRTADAIVSYALSELYEENLPPKEVKELVNSELFEKECSAPNLCVLSFFPDLMDSGVEGRNNYLKTLRAVAEAQKRKPLNFLWAPALAQSRLEKELGVGGSGYPALVVMNAKKQRLGHMLRAYTEEAINKYIDGLLAGKEVTVPLPEGLAAKVQTTTPWDGKAPALEELQEVDLSELGIEVPKVEPVHDTL